MSYRAVAGIIPHMGGTIAKRIEERLEAVGLSARKASLNAGLGADAIRNILRGKSESPRGETLNALARVLQCSPDYLLGNRPDPGEPIGRRANGVQQDREMIGIDELDIAAGAAAGGRIAAEIENRDGDTYEFIPVRRRWSIPAEMAALVTPASAERLKIVPIIGNSMAPDFRPGQRVLVDTTDRTPSPPGVFVVWDGLNFVVKLVEYIPFSDPPTVRIKSKNPDFEPYERTLDEAYIQGRVIGQWQWT